MKWICILLLVVSCAEHEIKVTQIDPVLKFYVDRVYFEGEARGVYLRDQSIIVLSSQDLEKNSGWYGVSYRSYKTNPIQILIDANLAMSSDSTLIEWVVFHEFGHVLLNRDHCGECESIMAPTAKHLTKDVREKLLDELFK